MKNAKTVNVPLAAHFALSNNQCPKTDHDKTHMQTVPYANSIGSIMYLMVCTRPDIAYAVSCLSRYMADVGQPHWEAVKWLLRYLGGSRDVCIKFCNSKQDIVINGFVDSKYANDRDSHKSSTSYAFTLCGSCVSWKSQLQHVVALSTT